MATNEKPSRKPRVSIGLPVYNGERYLTRALDSLLAQTYRDFEIVISDNCSDDATEQICRSYAERDARVVYIRQPENTGACANFNFVFDESCGEYFKWAAYDDLCEPEFIEQCVQALDDHPEAVWCHTASDRIDENDQSWLGVVSADNAEFVREIDGKLQWVGHPRRDYDSPSASRRFAGVIMGTSWSVDSYGLIRRTALQRTQLIQSYYGSEKVLMGELALQGPYLHVPQLLFAQRIHAEASSNIGSAEFQAAFAAGDTGKQFVPTRFAILGGHMRAIAQANLSLWQRAKCYGALARYVMQFRKWGRIVGAVFGGRGVGGDGVDVMVNHSRLMQETSA